MARHFWEIRSRIAKTLYKVIGVKAALETALVLTTGQKYVLKTDTDQAW